MTLQQNLTRKGLASALRNVFDPETGINIVDMGLIYNLWVENGIASVTLSYSSPSCPMGPMITGDIEKEVSKRYPGTKTEISVVFDPLWHPSMMSQTALDSF